jgi:hypothetical protein
MSGKTSRKAPSVLEKGKEVEARVADSPNQCLSALRNREGKLVDR